VKPDLRILVTCASCGADLQELTAGRIIHGRDKAGSETRAIWRCTECPKEYVIEVFLRLVSAHRSEVGCGTDAGFQRHHRAGETPCGECVDAHSRNRNPDGTHTGRRQSGTGWDAQRKARKELLDVLRDEELVDA
jgi:hypothetical protein